MLKPHMVVLLNQNILYGELLSLDDRTTASGTSMGKQGVGSLYLFTRQPGLPASRPAESDSAAA
jgi:hypothetical protein